MKFYVFTIAGEGSLGEYNGPGRKPYNNHLYTEQEKSDIADGLAEEYKYSAPEWVEVEGNEEMLKSNKKVYLLVNTFQAEVIGEPQYIRSNQLCTFEEAEVAIETAKGQREYIDKWGFESPLYKEKDYSITPGDIGEFSKKRAPSPSDGLSNDEPVQ